MRLKSGIFICSAVLTILIGINAETQSVQAADTSSDTTAVASTTSTAKTSTDVQSVSNAGGDWSIDPTTATPQDNLYYSVNGDWLNNTQVSDSDGGVISYQTIQSQQATKDITTDIDNLGNGSEKTNVPQIQQAADYYQRYLLMLNSSSINTGSLGSDVTDIENLKDYSELNSKLTQMYAEGASLPFSLTYKNDLDDNTKTDLSFNLDASNMPYISTANSTSKADFIDGMTILLGQLGISQSQANLMIQRALNFQNDLTSTLADLPTNNGTDSSNLTTVPLSKVYPTQSYLKLEQLMRDTFPNATNVQIPESFDTDSYNKIFSNGNFQSLKDWLAVSQVYKNAELFGPTGQAALAKFSNDDHLLANITQSKQTKAFNAAENYFQDEFSMYYGMKHLGSNARAKVQEMAEKIRDAYVQKLENNTWLSDTTKKAAINKLENIVILAGYPESIPAKSDFSKVKFTDDESLYDINKELNNSRYIYNRDNFGLPLDRTMWTKSSYDWNSTYYPISNSITIDAAMLQAPFFSTEQSDSQNYGGIGAVIGHEITHAFDNNGSKYNENGIKEDWWTDADKAKFAELSQDMLKEYDGIDFVWGTVNGQSSLNENMADNGGLSVALQVAQTLPGFNAQEFFNTWAKSWRIRVAKDGEAGMMFEAHAPYPIRVNVTAQNQPEFYRAFNVKKGDAMWLDPTERVTIW
ncbi:M13 family metallopeptidase [Companilactobacillus sp.]|jgi:putative endopeptidase|uniref:M13 family metallopeptidase n=1 Tax=Companilactobacillus sp. TaxID=2767905 RepID=UPI0025C2611A|nr:M13 family metallopeptidase [Companilactobacillus sp.]MCH4009061.1 M13 family metallopeptidase [Companilactobacillus sp.]MCH4050760.1 M13 family metallopeptidase [Companilactobacillus sp.]MCH4077003.1 M13 family metallopeptidase [Companilactobacillus sp.]MCH4125579.1 M13 family metallopeptidase [Companilactobacillus sp.]MCI1311288.1 M13 family metallopeptidase [Companilactobacillus sp.]